MKILNRVMVSTVTVLMASFVITMAANIVMRYFFRFSLVWSDEFARFSFIWVAMIGACLAFIRGQHLGFDLIVSSLKSPLKEIVDLINQLLVLVFLVMFCYYGTVLALGAGMTPSPSLKIPMGIVYVILPISAIVMILTLLQQMWTTLRALRAGGADKLEPHAPKEA